MTILERTDLGLIEQEQDSVLIKRISTDIPG